MGTSKKLRSCEEPGGGGIRKLRGKLIRNLYQKTTFVSARVVFLHIIFKIYSYNNARYLNEMDHDTRDTLQDAGRTVLYIIFTAAK